MTAFIVAVCTPNSTSSVAAIVYFVDYFVVEFLLGLSGSILGATICFIFPGLSYLHLKSNTEEAKDRWKAMVSECGLLKLFENLMLIFRLY